MPRKQSSSKVSSLAARRLSGGKLTDEQTLSLAASVLSQTEEEPKMARNPETTRRAQPDTNIPETFQPRPGPGESLTRTPESDRRDDDPKFPRSHKDGPTDGDIANPVDATDIRRPPDQFVQETLAERTARQARENEIALGQGKPLPFPTE